MEIQLVLGANSSGKSEYAEQLAVKSGEPRIYLATMMPQTEENYKRIEKHRMQRKDRGFTTIEEPWNLKDIEIPKDSVVLLEDVSNLLANGIFVYVANAQQALAEILNLAKRCRKLIIVSISGLSPEGYVEETRDYINQLNWLNDRLIYYSSEAVEMKDGIARPSSIEEKLLQRRKNNYAYFCNRECEYFPCHKNADENNFNCLFCYCPLYVLGDDCGGEFKYTKSGKKDCSLCMYPHRAENYEEITGRFQEIAARMKKPMG